MRSYEKGLIHFSVNKSFLYWKNYFFHVTGVKMRSIGKSSSLPASMSKIRTSLDKGEKNPKFDVGPASSRPGPMLFRHAETAVKFETPSMFSNDKAITDITNKRM